MKHLLSRRLTAILSFSLILILSIAACTPSQTQSGSSTLKVKAGATPIPHAEILAFIRDNLAAAAGLEIEIVEFTDYVQPNLALNDGTLDANFFQHVPYLDNFNESRGTDLVSIANVHIEPLGIYSKTITDLSQVPDGAVVIIPNDDTNGGRALNLLLANGFITLKPDAGYSATVADIADNPKNLKITELEAAQLVRSLDDADLAVINGNYALEGGLIPSQDALALESGENNPYVNILAVKSGKENDEAILALVKLLNSPEVKAFIEEKYAGSVLPAFGK